MELGRTYVTDICLLDDPHGNFVREHLRQAHRQRHDRLLGAFDEMWPLRASAGRRLKGDLHDARTDRLLSGTSDSEARCLLLAEDAIEMRLDGIDNVHPADQVEAQRLTGQVALRLRLDPAGLDRRSKARSDLLERVPAEGDAYRVGQQRPRLGVEVGQLGGSVEVLDAPSASSTGALLADVFEQARLSQSFEIPGDPRDGAAAELLVEAGWTHLAHV